MSVLTCIFVDSSNCDGSTPISGAAKVFELPQLNPAPKLLNLIFSVKNETMPQ